MDTDSTQNQISGGESHTVIQAGTTGPITTGDQISNTPQIIGDNANVNIINGDNHAPITFGR